jgi:gamma-D-glutamyl-L-lysine dipeptidyl-peptidase
MVTQLLFGETYELLSVEGDWLRIRTLHDNYECWLSERQHAPLPQTAVSAFRSHTAVFAADLVHVMHDRLKKTSFPITIGASLPAYHNHNLPVGPYLFRYEGTVTPVKKGNGQDIVSTSFLFLNAPYLWGGRSPFGIDLVLWKRAGRAISPFLITTRGVSRT